MSCAERLYVLVHSRARALPGVSRHVALGAPTRLYVAHAGARRVGLVGSRTHALAGSRSHVLTGSRTITLQPGEEC
jgi:hypothetical protein